MVTGRDSRPDEAQPGRLKPVRLTDQICRAIKQQIFRGELRPGDRVVEQKIAKQFGTGQNPVREALIELSHQGFVRRLPNRGTYITKIDFSDARKIARVRGPLEHLMIDLAIRRLDNGDILDFSDAEAAAAQMRRAAKKGNAEDFFNNDLLFHRTLWKLSGNDYLAQMLEQLIAPLFAFFVVADARPMFTHLKKEQLLDSTERHASLMLHIRERKATAAHAILDDLLDLSIRQQREVFPGGAQPVWPAPSDAAK